MLLGFVLVVGPLAQAVLRQAIEREARRTLGSLPNHTRKVLSAEGNSVLPGGSGPPGR